MLPLQGCKCNACTPQLWHRAEELPASARMLTLLALYHDYAGGGGDGDGDGDGDSFALRHFAKARALARLLIARRAASLHHGADDARYGIPVGGGDARAFSSPLAELARRRGGAPSHWCASVAEPATRLTNRQLP